MCISLPDMFHTLQAVGPCNNLLHYPVHQRSLLVWTVEREAMAANKRQTSSKAATAASKVLRDGRTSAASKTAAASALSQKGKGKK